jgi:hypothetical protein
MEQDMDQRMRAHPAGPPVIDLDLDDLEAAEQALRNARMRFAEVTGARRETVAGTPPREFVQIRYRERMGKSHVESLVTLPMREWERAVDQCNVRFHGRVAVAAPEGRRHPEAEMPAWRQYLRRMVSEDPAWAQAAASAGYRQRLTAQRIRARRPKAAAPSGGQIL